MTLPTEVTLKSYSTPRGVEFSILWRGKVVSVGQPERYLKDSILTVIALEGSKDREAQYRAQSPAVTPQPVKAKTDPARLKRVSVKSATQEKTYYTMVCHRDTGEVISCSCPGFYYRKWCHHKTDYEIANKKD